LPIRVEQIYLSKDFKSLIGIVAVANLAFEKHVTARFTFDYWKTTSEVAAEFLNTRAAKPLNDGYDRFQFCIKLSEQANLQNKTMYLCVRYNVDGQEYWDSNAGNNFQVDFIRKMPTKPPVRLPGNSSGGIPRSRHTGPQKLPRPRSFPASSADDEFSTSFDDSPFKLRKAVDAARSKDDQAGHHDSAVHHAANRLSNRYDFNASLHAALTTAQNALGERSGLKLKKPDPPKPIISVPVSAPVQSTSANQSRPDLDSAEYKDLIQKFCYFGSNVNSGNATEDSTPQNEESAAKPVVKQEMNDQGNSSSDSNLSSADSSASNSPPSPKIPLHPVDAQEPKSSPRSTAIRGLSPRLLPFRTPSPVVNSAYHEFPHQGLSVQTTLC
jgi:Carbohydrate/starch-binding module (family 21)